MGIKERKERDREKQRELILQAAGDIFAEEGLDKLSIRKIAEKIEYSPAIIYHYFKDKEDIVSHLMTTGYQRLLHALSSVKTPAGQPETRLRELIRAYIEAALQMPDVYLAVLLNKSPGVLEYTSYLFPGASAQKPALAILTQCLKDIHGDSSLGDDWFERTAQIIAASILGLAIRLIIEQNIGEEQRSKLIKHHIDFIMAGAGIGGISK